MRWSPTLLLLGACVSAPRPPPLLTYALGEGRATYRDYRVEAGEGLCDAEPGWLMDELSAVNTLLERFLRLTETNGAEWTPKQLSLIDEAAKSLPAVLDAHAHTLKALQKCSFSDERAFPALRKSGLTYVEDARLRVKKAPAVAKAEPVQEERELEAKPVEAKPLDAKPVEVKPVEAKPVEAKREEPPAKQVSTREAACPRAAKISATPKLYYAYRDERSALTYYFCDGVTASAGAGSAPRLRAPDGLSAKDKKLLKFFTPAYLRTIKAYPAEDVRRVPPVQDPQSMVSEQRSTVTLR